MPTMRWVVVDMSSLRTSYKNQGRHVIDGVIGIDMLERLSAFVDTRDRAVYVRNAEAVEYAMWGEWRSVSTIPGDAAKARQVQANRFLLDWDNVELRLDGKARKYKVSLHDDFGTKNMYLIPDPAPDQVICCRYKYDDTTLIIAGPLLPGDDPKAKPKSLAPPKPGEPKYSVLTFRRAKPLPAAKPDPIAFIPFAR